MGLISSKELLGICTSPTKYCLLGPQMTYKQFSHFIDGNSKIRLLQIGGAASNKDIDLVQNGTDFGDPVGTSPDGTWYKIPAP